MASHHPSRVAGNKWQFSSPDKRTTRIRSLQSFPITPPFWAAIRVVADDATTLFFPSATATSQPGATDVNCSSRRKWDYDYYSVSLDHSLPRNSRCGMSKYNEAGSVENICGGNQNAFLLKYSRVSVIRLSVESPTRLYVSLVKSHTKYFTWRYTEYYFHLYVPLSSTSKFLSPDLDV